MRLFIDVDKENASDILRQLLLDGYIGYRRYYNALKAISNKKIKQIAFNSDKKDIYRLIDGLHASGRYPYGIWIEEEPKNEADN